MSMQRCNQRKGLAMFAWLSLLVCLISASSIHNHENGIHLLNACQLCSLEEVTAHSASIVANAISVIETEVITQDDTVLTVVTIIGFYKTDIRGSPTTA